MERLSAPDEELFERVVLGELAADSLAARSRAEASPAFAQALAEWVALSARLQQEKLAAERAWEEALAEVTPTDREQVRRLAHPLLQRQRLRRMGVRGALAAAAALWLVLAPLYLLRGGGEKPAKGLLGEPEHPADASYPQGEVESFARFTVDAPASSWYRLAIVVRDEAGVELATSTDLRTLEWRPTESMIERMQRAGTIVWEYELEDVANRSQRVGGPYRARLAR